MHDPNTLAFEIPNYLIRVDRHGYRPALLTIWHHDPEKHGDDNSCGWHLRSYHLNKDMMDKVRREFAFNFEHNYWFSNIGLPKFSTIGTVICMYEAALWQILLFENDKDYDRARRLRKRFMRKHLADIIYFAENPTDSLFQSINLIYGEEKPEERIRHFASVVCADIANKRRHWWQHPRWHVHHWRIQFHPFRQLKRRYWDKCSICGKRGFKGPAHSDYHGTRIWHSECDKNYNNAPSANA